jgi:hypothetical protein
VNVLDPVLARVEVEHDLLGRVARDVTEESAAIARVVQGTEEGRRGDRAVWREVVQVGVDDRPALHRRLLDHPWIGVHADVLESRQEVRQPAVAAGEVDQPVAVLERRAERADQLGAVAEVRDRVGVLAIGPRLDGQRAKSRSGCLRTNRMIERQCQMVRRVQKVWSVSASQR